MIDSLQVVVALLLYLALFAWIGYRRGSLREGIVFVVALGGWLVLRQYQSAVVTLFNLFFKFIQFARSGGLTGDDPDAILIIRDAPNLIQPEEADTAIFLVWAAVLLITYLISGRAVRGMRNQMNATAMLFGILNGLLYLSIFLPLLGSILAPEAIEAETADDGLGLVLGRAFDLVSDSLEEVWIVLGEQQPLVIFLLLTLILVLAASTLRGPGTRSQTGATGSGNSSNPNAR